MNTLTRCKKCHHGMYSGQSCRFCSGEIERPKIERSEPAACEMIVGTPKVEKKRPGYFEKPQKVLKIVRENIRNKTINHYAQRTIYAARMSERFKINKNLATKVVDTYYANIHTITKPYGVDEQKHKSMLDALSFLYHEYPKNDKGGVR